MTIRFFRRGNMIVTRMSHKKDMIRLTTGIEVPPHISFYETKERFGGRTPDVEEYNDRLKRERDKMANLFEACGGDMDLVRKSYNSVNVVVEEPEDYSLKAMFNKYIKMANAGEIRTRKKTKFKESSIRTYNSAAGLYADFVSAYGDVDVMELNLLDKPSLPLKKAVADKLAKHMNNFGDFMLARKKSINTRHDYINFISIALRYWEKELFLQLPKIDIPELYEPPIVTVPNDFVGPFLKDSHRLYNKFSDEHKAVWELSALVLTTTLRANDALSLKPEDFRYIDREMYLIKDNEKNGEESTIPMPSQVQDRLTYNINNFGRIFRVKLNYTQLTALFPTFWAFYPELHAITTYKRLNYASKTEVVSEKICDLIHPHMLRKTAITGMLANGVSVEHVRFASGHRSNAIERYRGWVDRTHKSEIREHFNRILK